MRLFKMAAAVLMVSVFAGCGGVEGGAELEPRDIAQQEQELRPVPPPALWCMSYPTKELCPKHVCAWTQTALGGMCTLPAEQ